MAGLGVVTRRRAIQASPVQGNYIRFADPVAKKLCIDNFSSDGIGLSPEDAAAVTSIGLVFAGNKDLVSFDEFKYFTSVTSISTGADAVSGGAFANCTALKSIILPESLTDIRPFAFYGCTSLESINLENEHITIIGNEAFKNCGEMRVNINLPNLQILGSCVSADVFMYSGIVSITSLGVITRIWGYGPSVHGTFLGCENLTKAVLPQTLTIIGGRAFQDCTQLSELNIPISVTTIEEQALYNCTSLIIYELTTPNLEVIQSASLSGVRVKKWLDMGKITSLTLSGIVKEYLEELVIPSTVTQLPNVILNGCTSLISISIDWGQITKVGSNAIRDVPAFTNSELIISNLASASAYAFNGSLVKSIDLTGSPITSIGRVFEQCPNLLTIVLPENVETIGAYLARQSTLLKEIILKAITPPTLNGDSLSQINSTFVIYVPDEAAEAYRIATNWSHFADRIKPMSSYELY